MRGLGCGYLEGATREDVETHVAVKYTISKFNTCFHRIEAINSDGKDVWAYRDSEVELAHIPVGKCVTFNFDMSKHLPRSKVKFEIIGRFDTVTFLVLSDKSKKANEFFNVEGYDPKDAE